MIRTDEAQLTGLPPEDYLDLLNEGARHFGLTTSEIRLPDSRHILVGSVRLHYLDWGAADGPPILFLHGGSLNAHTWDLVCVALRSEYHCIAPDLRGHGDSEWSPGMFYRLSDHVADITGLIAAFCREKPILVGMSLGGLAALTYAADHAESLAALVVVDVAPEATGGGGQAIRAFVAAPDELDSIDAYVERALAFNPKRRRETLRRSLLHSLRRTVGGTWVWKYDRRRHAPAVLEDHQRSRQELAIKVSQITCPTLVVRGAESTVLLEQDAQRLLEALPCGRLVTIQGAGHTVQGDQPSDLAAAMRGFLSERMGMETAR